MTTWVVTMELATVKEFRDQATKFLRSRDPVLITRRGKPAGIYVALQEGQDLPLDFRKELLLALAAQVKRSMESRGLTETALLDDFETSRKARR